MSSASIRVWLLLAALSVGDFVWSEAKGVVIADWWPLIPLGAALLAVSLAYRRGGRNPRLAAAIEWILLWIVFSVSGALLTYLAAAHNGPLYDAQLAAADHAIGFHWHAWFRFVTAHPALEVPFAIAYHSLLPQIVLSVAWFSFLGRDERNAELLIAVTVALLLTTALFLLVPSLGPCAGVPAFRDLYVSDLTALRNGTMPSIDVMLLKGVIAFPSFHAVLASLFTYAHRRSPIFVPVALFNLLMLAALPSQGGHHLVDVLGGIAVAIAALLAARAVPTRLPALAPTGTA